MAEHEPESGAAEREDAASRYPPIPEGLYCPDCGYDLRSLTSARCPECGFGLEVVRAGESQIPWSYRRELGRFRAYWKTVWLVLRRPKQLCLELARPVSYRDSQSFRWVTLLHAYLPVLLGSVAWVVFDRLYNWQGGELMWWLLGGLQVWALLVLTLLPGLTSYLFQPKSLSVEQQNRAIALSYYAWAPLACVPLALPLATTPLASWSPAGNPSAGVLGALGGVVSLACLGLAYRRLNTFSRYTLHQSGGRRFLRSTLLSVLSVGLIVALALVPLTAFYLAVVVRSLG